MTEEDKEKRQRSPRSVRFPKDIEARMQEMADIHYGGNFNLAVVCISMQGLGCQPLEIDAVKKYWSKGSKGETT